MLCLTSRQKRVILWWSGPFASIFFNFTFELCKVFSTWTGRCRFYRLFFISNFNSYVKFFAWSIKSLEVIGQLRPMISGLFLFQGFHSYVKFFEHLELCKVFSELCKVFTFLEILRTFCWKTKNSTNYFKILNSFLKKPPKSNLDQRYYLPSVWHFLNFFPSLHLRAFLETIRSVRNK